MATYSKYNTISTTKWTYSYTNISGYLFDQSHGYAGFNFNSSTGIFSGTGTRQSFGDRVNYYLPSGDGKSMYYGHTIEDPGSAGCPGDNFWEFFGVRSYTRSSYIEYTRGTFIQAGIEAPEGTYPTDGRHTDGFWYVQTVKYIYDKFNTITTSSYVSTSSSPKQYVDPNVQTASTSYTFSTTTGIYAKAGTTKSLAQVPYYGTTTRTDGYRNMYYITSQSSDSCGYWYTTGTKYTGTLNTVYTKGTTYYGTVLADDGSLPNNGRHTDGFWYVRLNKIFPNINPNIGGSYKTCVGVWVNVGGVWKSAPEVHFNLNNIWKSIY